MFLDSALSFNTNWTTTQTLSTTADSATIIDVTGAGVGVAPSMIGGGANLTTAGIIGNDWGLSDGIAVPYVLITFPGPASSASNTLTVTLKAAPATSSNTEGTYIAIYTSPAFVASTLAVGTIIMFPVPPMQAPIGSDNPPPRFYKLTYTCSGALGGSPKVIAGIVLNPTSALLAGVNYPNNFVVA